MGQFWIISAHYITRLLITKCLNGTGSKASTQDSLSPLSTPAMGLQNHTSSYFPSFPGFLHTWLHCDNRRVENGPSNLTENIVSGAFIWWVGLWVWSLLVWEPLELWCQSVCARFLSPDNYTVRNVTSSSGHILKDDVKMLHASSTQL